MSFDSYVYSNKIIIINLGKFLNGKLSDVFKTFQKHFENLACIIAKNSKTYSREQLYKFVTLSNIQSLFKLKELYSLFRKLKFQK